MEVIRDSTFGQVLRYATGNRVLLYPEERSDFEIPIYYKEGYVKGEHDHQRQHQTATEEKQLEAYEDQLQKSPSKQQVNGKGVDNADSSSSSGSSDVEAQRRASAASNIHRAETLPYTPERLAHDKEMALERTKSQPIVPTKTADGTILVDW